MASFLFTHDRRKIFFSDHALDRWWERCRENKISGRKEALNLLKDRLAEAKWLGKSLPSWVGLSLWHQARAEGFLILSDEQSGFVINKNPSGDLVAVTYIERKEFT